MKPTKQQILECNDKAQLNWWAAEICEGWSKPDGHGFMYRPCILGGDEMMRPDEYQPCHDTDLGRSQCWQLMVKYKLQLIPYPDGDEVWFSAANNYPDRIIAGDENPHVAVVKVALLSVIGDE